MRVPEISLRKRTFGPVLAIGMLIFSWSSLKSQTHAPLQGWWQFYFKHKTESNWILEGDAGFRVHSMHFEPVTALARVGFGRQFKDFSLIAGAAWFESWPLSGSGQESGEFRLFQKLILPQKLGPVSLSHIYRAEERWLQQPLRSQYQLQLRLRYQLQAIYHFKNFALLGGKPYLNGHAEMFAMPNKQVFSQFRLFGGTGLNWKDRWRFELGYLAIWLPAKTTGNPIPGHALRMNLLLNL